MKKLLLSLFVGLCIAGAAFAAGGAEPTTESTTGGMSGEIPMLEAQVNSGELPPMAERIPEEPLVVTPTENIGTYGGIIQTVHKGVGDLGAFIYNVGHGLFSFTPEVSELAPGIAKGWDLSPDAKTLTIYLRNGMKWSDGAPFTADDFMFWYNDIGLNDELTPVKRAWLLNEDGSYAKLEKIDDYTLRWSYNTANSMVVEILLHDAIRYLYAPKHYLTQFHPDYTPRADIEKMMEAEEFDTIQNFFFSKYNYYNNPESPSIFAWTPIDTADAPIMRWRRNPYFWKVDTAGNQLPYIDGWDLKLVSTPEALLLETLSGNGDMVLSFRVGKMANYTLLMENREKGDYRLVPYLWPNNNIGAVFFNMSHEDPVLRELFNDKRFRVAISVAINRPEINELVFLGKATPSQPAPPDGSPFFGESEIFRVHTEYDPEQANALLDALGLDKRDRDGFRLRLDGERLRLQAMYSTADINHSQIVPIYEQNWEAVGIEFVAKPVDNKLLDTAWSAADFDIIVSGITAAGKPMLPINRADIVPTFRFNPGREWMRWIATNGSEGDEPPADVLKLVELRAQALGETDPVKRDELTMDVYRLHSENMWVIGGFSEPTALGNYIIMDNRIKNVQVPMPILTFMAHHSSWYIEQ